MSQLSKIDKIPFINYSGVRILNILIFLFFLSSCLNRNQPDISVFNEGEKSQSFNNDHSIISESGNSFFYGLYSPDEISNIFKNADITYSPEFMAPAHYASKFSGSSKIALNLGVYGANFSITKLFNNTEDALSYMEAISLLSKKLGIPEDLFSSSYSEIEKHADNIDSLSLIVNQSFNQITDYLMENDRENSISLILLGGWTESLYLAMKFMDNGKPNNKIIEKIVQQKYSLNFLMSILKNTYQDPAVTHYYQQYRVLQNYFERMVYSYRKEDFQIDTVNKVILSSWAQLNYTNEDMLKLKKYTMLLRENIITP